MGGREGGRRREEEEGEKEKLEGRSRDILRE